MQKDELPKTHEELLGRGTSNITAFINHSLIQGKKVNIDPDLIKWSLENLIKNSLDAMKNNIRNNTMKVLLASVLNPYSPL